MLLLATLVNMWVRYQANRRRHAMERSELSLEDLTRHMAGGVALEAPQDEMRSTSAPDLGVVHELAETN